MGIAIPDAFVGSSFGDQVAGQPVRAATFKTIAEDQHRLFAVKGARIPGFLARDPGTLTSGVGSQWQPTGSWSQSSGALGGVNAGTWAPGLRAFRDLEGDVVVIQMACFLKYASVRFFVKAPESGAVVGLLTLSNGSSDWLWARGTMSISSADARAGGVLAGSPRPLTLYAEAQLNGDPSGRIAQIAGREYVLTSTDTTQIPRG